MQFSLGQRLVLSLLSLVLLLVLLLGAPRCSPKRPIHDARPGVTPIGCGREATAVPERRRRKTICTRIEGLQRSYSVPLALIVCRLVILTSLSRSIINIPAASPSNAAIFGDYAYHRSRPLGRRRLHAPTHPLSLSLFSALTDNLSVHNLQPSHSVPAWLRTH